MAEAGRVIAFIRGSLPRLPRPPRLAGRSRAGRPDNRPRESLSAIRERIAEIGRDYRYHAFVSYSHYPDQPLARSLRRSLQNVATHWWERGQMRVFLDEASLIPGDGLDSRLTNALDGSAALILLASGSSAASPWVRLELEYWRELGRQEILIAHTGEGIVWPPGANDFDWERTRALSAEVFGGTLSAPPSWVDLAMARRHPRLRAVVVRAGAVALAAAILGVEPHSLVRRELRRLYLRVATAAAATLTAITTVVLSLLASNLVAQNAEQVQLNVAQRLLDAASHAGPVDEELLLAAAAYREAPGSPVRYGLAEQADLNPGLRRVLHVPSGGIGTVSSVSYSPHGRLLAAATSSPNSDAAVLVWPGQGTGHPVQDVLPAAALATSVAFSPDGRIIAVGDSGGGITLITVSADTAWPPLLTTGPRLGSPKPPKVPGRAGAGQVDRVSFAPGGRLLAASYADGMTAVWQLTARSVLAWFPGAASEFSPVGATLASLGPTGTVAVRNARTLAPLATYRPDVANPVDLAYRPDGKVIAVTSGAISASLTPTVAIVNLVRHTAQPIGGSSGTGPVAYGANDEVVTDSDLIHAASTARPQPARRFPRIAAESIAFDPAGGLIAVGGSWLDGSDGAVLLLDTSTVTLPASVVPPGGIAASYTGAPASALSRDGRTLAVTGQDGSVKLLTAATGQPATPRLRPGVAFPARLAFSPDGTELAGVNGRQVTIWSLHDGSAHDFTLPAGVAGDEAGGLAFSPDGRLLAVAGPDGQIMLLRTAFPISATSLPGSGPACDLAFSPDGRYLAAATPGGAQLWNVASRQHTATLAAGSASAPMFVDGADCRGTVAVSFVLGGAKLAATDGNTITIWTLASRARATLPSPLLNPAASLRTNPGFDVYTHLATSQDGALLAAGTEGSAVFVWDMTTQQQAAVALLPVGPVDAVGFGPSGNTVLSFGAFVTAWNIDPRYWLTWACDVVQGNLTAAEWNRYGSGPQVKECDEWP